MLLADERLECKMQVNYQSNRKVLEALTLCSCFIHLCPPVPPTIAGGDDGPNERKVVLSKPLILECEAGGHPPPSLTWLKDGVPVRDGESVRVLEQGSKIEILSATVSDSGRYVCVATSIAGEKEVKYDVRVLGIETHKNNVQHIHTHASLFLSLECHQQADTNLQGLLGKQVCCIAASENACSTFLNFVKYTFSRRFDCLFACMLWQYNQSKALV